MRFLFLFSLLLVLFLGLSIAEPVARFDDICVLRLSGYDVQDPSQNEAITALKNTPDFKVDFWSTSDVAIPIKHVAPVQRFLSRAGISSSILHQNVQTLIDNEREDIRRAGIFNAESGADTFFTNYRTLDEFQSFWGNLSVAYPGFITSKLLGHSYEGREMWAYIITSNKTAAASKPTILYEGGIHAREWIAHMTVTYVGYQLLSNYGTDAHITKLVDSFTWIIISVVNPDGYAFTWSNNRMWRKTRSPNKGSICIGTDPNRNWNNHWCEEGADTSPCSDSYCGSKAFSEVEVNNVAQFILNWQADASHGKIIEFIDFHSYSQLWMSPYGWTANLPKDSAKQNTAGLAAVAAIKKSSGLVYGEGPIYTTIYPASGSSADWGYDQAGIVYSYGVELRDLGQYGFQLPPAQIVPCGNEILAAVLSNADIFLNDLQVQKTADC
jgi:carboxypeptidase A1